MDQPPFPPAILLYGQEQGLIAKQIAEIRDKIIKDEGEADFDAETFYAGDISEERFINACQAFPFLSTRRFVLLKDADRIAIEPRTTLLNYLEKPSATTMLVVHAGNLDAKNLLRKGFESSKTAWAIPFYPLEGRALSGWIRQQLQQDGYTVDNDALQYLSLRLDGDTMAAANELEKLQLFLGDNRQVGLNEVMAVVGETSQFSSFGLATAISNGEVAQALNILDRLLASGEEPLALMGIITRRIRQLIQGQDLLKNRENPKMVVRKLGIFWREEREFLTQCNTVPAKNLADSLLDCLEADQSLKGGGGTPKRVMGGLVMRLCGRFGGRR